MALYTSQTAANKRQKTVRDVSSRTNVAESTEFFAGVTKIEYKPDASPDETMCYRYYNPSERIHGRTMEEWLRPSVSFWHSFHCSSHYCFDSSYYPVPQRPWDDGTHSMDNFRQKIRAAFELYSKLGIKYWTFWDRDLGPEGETLEETNHILDECVDFVYDLQQRMGIRPLWVAANLHSSFRFINGACTSAEAQITAYAGAQIKKALEIANKLGAECFLLKGIKEGYSTSLNTDHSRQLRNYARMLKLTTDYKEQLGFRGQLLYEPSYEYCTQNYNCKHFFSNLNYEELYHHYNYDTPSSICFLKNYSLDRQYRISTKPGHQLNLAVVYGMLGSVDATFITTPPNIYTATHLMKAVIENGGLQPGGLNIGISLHLDSSDCKDMVTAYVSCIDGFAKALRNAVKIIGDGFFTKNLQQRYWSFNSGFGSRFMNGEASLEECEEQIKKQNSEVTITSGRPEYWETVFSRYIEQSK